jgi:antitoxin component YwqK of YwqJK toxin-antitoxin module
MNKINKILLFLPFIIIGCEEKEVSLCNLKTDNGITYFNNKVYNGTCYLVQGDENVIWKKVSYKRGKLSKEIAYFDNGSIDYIGFRNRNGEIDGNFIKYFINGEIELEGNIDNGYRDGVWKIYNDSGVLIEEVNYNMGEIVESTKY